MPFVLDSSVALAWFLPDEDSTTVDALADRLENDYAVVPAIWPLEVGNALLVAQRRGRIKDEEIARFVNAIGALPIEIDPSSASTKLLPIVELAKKHGLTTYDAGYIDLAQRRALALATLDAKLRAACEALNLALLP
jgi:predicted nucleic acid-binding protein